MYAEQRVMAVPFSAHVFCNKILQISLLRLISNPGIKPVHKLIRTSPPGPAIPVTDIFKSAPVSLPVLLPFSSATSGLHNTKSFQLSPLYLHLCFFCITAVSPHNLFRRFLKSCNIRKCPHQKEPPVTWFCTGYGNFLVKESFPTTSINSSSS